MSRLQMSSALFCGSHVHARSNTNSLFTVTLFFRWIDYSRFGFYDALNSSGHSFSVAFYREREKSDKFRLEVFYVLQMYDMGPTVLLPFQRKSYSGFLHSEKNPSTPPSSNPRTSDLVASIITTVHRPSI